MSKAHLGDLPRRLTSLTNLQAIVIKDINSTQDIAPIYRYIGSMGGHHEEIRNFTR